MRVDEILGFGNKEKKQQKLQQKQEKIKLRQVKNADFYIPEFPKILINLVIDLIDEGEYMGAGGTWKFAKWEVFGAFEVYKKNFSKELLAEAKELDAHFGMFNRITGGVGAADWIAELTPKLPKIKKLLSNFSNNLPEQVIMQESGKFEPDLFKLWLENFADKKLEGWKPEPKNQMKIAIEKYKRDYL